MFKHQRNKFLEVLGKIIVYGVLLEIISELIFAVARLALPAFVAPALPLQILVSLAANFMLSIITNFFGKVVKKWAEKAATNAQAKKAALEAENPADIVRLANILEYQKAGIPVSVQDVLFLDAHTQLRKQWKHLEAVISSSRQSNILEVYADALDSTSLQVGMAASIALTATYIPTLLTAPAIVPLVTPKYLVAAAGGMTGKYLGWLFNHDAEIQPTHAPPEYARPRAPTPGAI